MADQKLDQLTEDSAPLATDEVYVVHDPAGTPADRKVKLANLLKGVPASGATVTGTPPALEVAPGSLDQTAFKPTTLFPASNVAIPTDGAAGTPTMRSQGTGVGQSAKGSDPLGLGLAINEAYMFPFGLVQSSLTSLAVYCSRFIGGSPATKIRIHVDTSSGNIRAAVFSSKNSGPAAAPDAVKMDTGTIACPAAGNRDLSFISGGTINVGDWFLFVCDNGTAKFLVSFFNSTDTLFSPLSGYFTIASMAAFPSSAPALTSPFMFIPFAMGIP